MRRTLSLTFLVLTSVALAFVAEAQQAVVSSAASTTAPPATTASSSSQPTKPSKAGTAAGAKTTSVHIEPSVRIEGEKRFRANCSRCHMAPQKLPPRAAATIIRHMRVRATITDEDMRYILAYLAQ